MSLTTELLLIVALAIANGLFSGAEIAVLSVRKGRLGELVAEGNQAAVRVQRLRHQPERFLATVQIGITIIGATTAAFGGAALSSRFAVVLRTLGFGRHADSAAFTAVILFVSYISLVLGELVPKSLALRGAERYALLASRPMLWLAAIARPVVWFLTGSSNLLLRFVGDRTNFTEARLSPEELRQLVEEATHEGVIEPVAGEIASRALDFGQLRVAALMVPRSTLPVADANLAGARLLELALRTTSDRFPLHEGSVDNITGYVTVRDLLLAYSNEQSLGTVARTAYYVPESARAVDTLREMQRRQSHMAMVVDEQGAVVGAVTLEDLVEELVGDIFSEHEKPTEVIRPQADGSIVVQGTAAIRELNRSLDLDLPENSAWTTLAGFVIAQVGAIPSVGRVLDLEGVQLEVLEATHRRILSLRLRRTQPQ